MEVGNSDDEAPYFPYTIYMAAIPEDAALGTEVKVISAIDNDKNKMVSEKRIYFHLYFLKL